MAAKPRKKTGKLVTLAELSRAWEYHKNADQVLGARMSYGMIAQSMFLLSYVTFIWLPPNRSGCLPPFNWALRHSAFGTRRDKTRWPRRRSRG